MNYKNYKLTKEYQWREESLKMIMLHSSIHREHKHYEAYLDEYILQNRLMDYFCNYLKLPQEAIEMISLYRNGYGGLRVCDEAIRCNSFSNEAYKLQVKCFLELVFNGVSNIFLAGIYTRKEIEKLIKLTGAEIENMKEKLDDFEKSSKEYIKAGEKLRNDKEFIETFLENEQEYLKKLDEEMSKG
ncbi:hypothetical protein DMB95_07005 [Campylobacter sp. MIT 12-8780]|uniref:hypothetical protein n=1 Tax=unclassified Campylobacter TaxID=2593542 RepID=UPI00115CB8FE|nr:MULTISPECIES: hypothetical protein [unclassified Campylobacter]NDJ27712.1 hypothetical protein [Campylobacter sp. MIT 19-121]TQR40874.1 hypothetical protein DMB95_07005 [Campylobacter sp. MIT 12-8780]